MKTNSKTVKIQVREKYRTVRNVHDVNKNGVDDRLDLIVRICAIILPFTTIPQLKTIYIDKEVSGVSAITWFLYGVLTIPLFLYSIKRKETPYIILNGLWVIVDLLVAIGVLMYS